MPTVVSIDEVPSARREAMWRNAVCDTFVRLDCTPERNAPLHGRIEAGKLGDLHVARVVGSAQRVERTRNHAARADEAFVLVSVQLHGRTVVRQAGSEAVLMPGSIAFYDTTRPYTLTLPGDFDQIVLHLPHQHLERSVPGGLDHMAQRMNASHPFAQAILALAPQLLYLVDSARPAIAHRTAAAAEELILLALDSLAANPPEGTEPTRPARAAAPNAIAWRTRELIGRQLEDAGLTPARLARQAGVSLRRLQEVFQSQGTTLTGCIWDMRLEFARGLLADAQHHWESIGTIAYRAGFNDLGHFSRRFKQRFGMSPREYRTALR